MQGKQNINKKNKFLKINIEFSETSLSSYSLYQQSSSCSKIILLKSGAAVLEEKCYLNKVTA